MNDAAVRRIWIQLDGLNKRVRDLEVRMNAVDARIRARLKEEAETRIQGIKPRREKASKMGPD